MAIKSEFFLCDCHSLSHLVHCAHFEEENEYYMEIYLYDYYFCERLYLGLRYLFNLKNNDGMFDTWILNRNDKEKFKKFFKDGNNFRNNCKCCTDDKYWFELKYDDELNIIFLNIYLEQGNFLKRLFNFGKYILKIHPSWTDWQLSKEDVIKIGNVANTIT